ncbi:MAG: ferritin family protein [Deltaproteobacteria bacterium]|nr:ferritin family protein [Deltaproteobacteria bacterium]MBW2072799.1 ferritin family protein [Deltaproteobacteria bacterium]
MAFEFNAEEIFRMAEQIERNGVRFYRRAAEVIDDAAVSQLMSELAAWEEGHEKLFAAMRARLGETEKQQTVFDPEDETASYLRAMADGHVFNVRQDEAAIPGGEETVQEILEQALQREKDSIVFYLGLQEFTADVSVKNKVEEIIREEMKHIGFLNKQMRALAR